MNKIYFFIFFSFFSIFEVEAKMSERQLRVKLSYRLPVDPLEIRSMADYDLALLLTDTWFDYDESRKAKENLISNWSFNPENGSYLFRVNINKKWSNGDLLTSQDLVWNLRRSIKLNTQFGKAISSIIDVDSIKTPDKNSIIIRTKDNKPSETFFQRMGGQPLAIVHISDVNPNTLKLISNKVTIGPYVLRENNPIEIRLEKNNYFNSENKQAPKEISIKQADRLFNIDDFLNKKTWENIIQVNSFLLPETEKLFKIKKLSFWTRGHDRVSLLKPMSKNNLSLTKALLIEISNQLDGIKFENLPLNVKRATSLQPIGYPLFDTIKPKKNKSKYNKNIKILTPIAQSNEYQKKLLQPIFEALNVKVTWDFKTKSEFGEFFLMADQHDLALFDFGVADPELSTWIGIVTTNKFIHLDSGDYEKFQEISKLSDTPESVAKYKDLLRKSYDLGNYVPLFHFSTLSIGHENIDFKAIKELDETVNYSKINIK